MKQTIKFVGYIFALVVCFASCGGNSKSEVNVPTEYGEELVKLAEDGNAEAQYRLGMCLGKGQGVSQDANEAGKWIEKAAAQGHVEAKLWDAIATENAATPVEVNKGVVLEKVFIEGDNVTYTYSVNESILPIENVIQNAENSKQMMISAFHSTEKGNNFAQLCKDANKGILYYYVGSSSNRNCTIKIEPSDL